MPHVLLYQCPMFRRYIILLIAFLIAISVTSCCSYEEAPSQAVAEELGNVLGEVFVTFFEIDIEWLWMPLILFQKTNDRLPDSKEELAEFSSEMGFNTPQLYWDSFEDMCFYTQDDGSLKIKFTRVFTNKDGTQYRLPVEVKSGKLEFSLDDPNLAHMLQEKITNDLVQRTEDEPPVH